MFAFFNMFISFFTFFIGFFVELARFFKTGQIFWNLRTGLRKILLTAIIPLIIIYVTVLMASFFYGIQALMNVFNLISTLIHLIQSGSISNVSSSPIIQTILYLINVTGIATGIAFGFPFLASALYFRLFQFLYKITLYLHSRLLALYRDVSYAYTS